MRNSLPPHNISLLAEKWLNGSISEEEMRVFNDWYNQFDDEEVLLPGGIDHYASHEMRQRLLQNVQRRVLREEVPADRPAVINRWYKFAAAAAILGIIVLSGYLTEWWGLQSAEWAQKIVQTSAGQRKKVILPDSSIVWLKPNSNISYAGTFSATERRVELQGEALFEVTKDARRPFIIQSGEYITRVLGTSFNIRYTQNLPFELNVFTGKVMVEKKMVDGTKQQAVLEPSQKVSAASAQRLVLLPSVATEKALSVVGTEYDMAFSNTSFRTIVEKIQKKFNVKCNIESKALEGCRLTADLTDQSLWHSLELIAASIDLNYRYQNGQVWLSGNGCE